MTTAVGATCARTVSVMARRQRDPRGRARPGLGRSRDTSSALHRGGYVSDSFGKLPVKRSEANIGEGSRCQPSLADLTRRVFRRVLGDIGSARPSPPRAACSSHKTRFISVSPSTLFLLGPIKTRVIFENSRGILPPLLRRFTEAKSAAKPQDQLSPVELAGGPSTTSLR